MPVRENIVTFERLPDGRGYLWIVETTNDGEEVQERYAARQMVDSEAAARLVAGKLFGVSNYEWNIQE